ncbi:MAG: DNA-3-methyladenine glycosylase [Thiohalomonadaceae bacterium]
MDAVTRTGRLRTVSLSVTPVPPFRLDLTVWALRRRAHNAVDGWDGRKYRRRFMLESGGVAEVHVVQVAGAARPRLKVDVRGADLGVAVQRRLLGMVTRSLGTSIDLQPFYALAAKDRRLGPLVARYRGLKPPRFPTVFEALVNGIACQQISLHVGITLLNRLAERFGAQGNDSPAFPVPGQLAGRNVSELRALGFSRQKARALIELAGAVVDGRVDLGALEGLDNAAALRQLLALRGVGRWTAEYVLLRGLGRVDVFPGDDVGARQRLARWLGREEPFDYAAVERVTRAWRPYAGLVYFHLLLHGLEEACVMQAVAD